MARKSSEGRPFTIFKRASATTWYIKFQRRQYSTGLPAEDRYLAAAEKKAWELVRLYERDQLTTVKATRITIEKAFERFMRDYGSLRSKKTQAHYRNSYAACFVRPHEALTRDNIIANIREARMLHTGVTVNGWNSYRTSITTMQRYWVREGMLHEAPDLSLLFVRKRPVAVKIWAQEEIDQIVTYFHERDPEYALFLQILAITGLRVHELLELTWAQITGDVVWLTSKDGNRNESIPMFSALRALLDEIIVLDPERTSKHRVWRWADSNVSRLRHRLHDACEVLGIDDEGRSFHTFRKTFVSRMAANGVDVRLAASLARCDVPVMMKHYTLLQGEKKSVAMQELAETFGSGDRKSDENDRSLSPTFSPKRPKSMPKKRGKMTKRLPGDLP